MTAKVQFCDQSYNLQVGMETEGFAIYDAMQNVKNEVCNITFCSTLTKKYLLCTCSCQTLGPYLQAFFGAISKLTPL